LGQCPVAADCIAYRQVQECMRHLRKKRDLPEPSPESPGSSVEPFGSWMQADLETLPRFPHRDSFPAAKGLISRFLQEGLSYQDLRIALFWLGFGLLDVPIPEEPTMSLVPLCKDLDTYVEIATELGYDPNASVHLRPVFCEATVSVEQAQVRPQIGNATSSASSHSHGTFVGSAGSSGSSSAPLEGSTALTAQFRPPPRRNAHVGESVEAETGVESAPGEPQQKSDPAFPSTATVHIRRHPFVMPAELEGHFAGEPEDTGAGSGSAVVLVRRPPLTSLDGQALPSALLEAADDTPFRGRHSRGRSVLDTADEDALALWGRSPSSTSTKGEGFRKGAGLPPCYYVDAAVFSEEENEEGARQAGNSSRYYEAPATGVETQEPPDPSAASSQVWGGGSEQVDLSYKVKLLYAGGWSDSSSSEGNLTPPTPPLAASSSSGLTSLQSGGLDMDHVEQFTVTFISDVQMHEDLEEISCLCTFCLDDMKVGEELCRLPCMHTFHRRCVHAWLERDRRCMLCRLDITRPRG